MKNPITRATALIAAAILLNSCLRDHTEQMPERLSEAVTFKISVPAGAGAAGQTRALDAADECTVEDISVLAFDKTAKTLRGRYIGRVVSGPTPSGGSAATLTFQVSLPAGEWDLMIVANGDRIFAANGASLGLGASQASVEAALTMDMTTGGWITDTSDSDYCAMPMWGYAKAVAVSAQSPSPIGTVHLTRMVAKVDVRLGAAVTSDIFELQTVRVYNYVEQGRLVPDTGGSFKWEEVTQSNLASNTLPCLPAGYTKAVPTQAGGEYLGYAVASPHRSLAGAIYLFEAPAGVAPSSGGTFTDNTCLVIGGSFEGGDQTWYRIDFARQTDAAGGTTYTYMPLLRNNSYTVTVTEISGEGHSTPWEALQSVPSNITANILDWNAENIGLVLTDGIYMLGVSQGAFSFSEDAHPVDDTDDDNLLTITTDHSGGWSATVWANEAGTAALTGDWLRLSTDEGTGNHPDGDPIRLIVDKNTSTTASRTAYVHIKAGVLNYIVEVTQAEAPIPLFPAYPGVLGIDREGRMRLDLTPEIGDMLYFKFGSVVGFVNQDRTVNTAWDNKYIVYNPSDLTVGTAAEGANITGYGSNQQTLPAIPCYSSTDFNTLLNHNVSHNEYHNLANIKAGKGDPCRLIGMTIEDIQKLEDDTELYALEAALKASGVGGWRLPTNIENAAYAGLTGAGTGGYSNTNYPYYVTNGGSLSDPNMGWFPIGGPNGTTGGTSTRFLNDASKGNTNPPLPAAGYRDATSAAISKQGTYGNFWSSTVCSNIQGYHLRFDESNVDPHYYNVYAHGLAVRCVQEPRTLTATRTDGDGNVPADGGTATFTVDTNVSTGWTAAVTTDDGTAYATLSADSGDTGTTSGITLTFAANGTNDNRSATVTFSATGADDVVITVTQAAKARIYAAPGVIGIRVQDYRDLLAARAADPNATIYLGNLTPARSLTIKGSKSYAGTWVEDNVAPRFGGLDTDDVYTVYFKWGSMVAMIGGTGDTWSADDVVWVNPGYNLTSYPITNTYSSFTPAGVTGTTGGQANNVASVPAQGHGDPCAYVDGATGSGSWKTPTGHPFTLTGETYSGTSANNTDKPFDTTDAVWATARNTYNAVTYWNDSNSGSNPADLATKEDCIPTGIDPNGQVVSDYQDLFLPAAGYRLHSSGAVNDQGSSGIYWSSTSTGSHGYYLYFDSTIVGPSNYGNYDFGFGVRCVRP